MTVAAGQAPIGDPSPATAGGGSIDLAREDFPSPGPAPRNPMVPSRPAAGRRPRPRGEGGARSAAPLVIIFTNGAKGEASGSKPRVGDQRSVTGVGYSKSRGGTT